MGKTLFEILNNNNNTKVTKGLSFLDWKKS